MNGLFTRRKFLGLMACAYAVMLAGCPREKQKALGNTASSAVSLCVVRPEQTEGPFFIDQHLNRSDIRVEPSTGIVKQGVPLALTLNVSQMANGLCAPLEGAIVDIWHCDAEGFYSGVDSMMQSQNTAAFKFLRGFQTTDNNGTVNFLTIFPGWYPGRTVHIHFKIRTKDVNQSSYEFTSQLYFDDAFSEQIYANVPYIRDRHRGTTNANDMIFAEGGDQLLLKPKKTDQGYAATFDIVLDMADAQTEK
jgi:protocatechuate 3,4-dioxygenase beta subunit